jgi:cytochrome c2
LLFPGIKDPQDRADLIAYLEMQKQLWWTSTCDNKFV